MFSSEFLQRLYADETISKAPIEYEVIVIHAIEKIVEEQGKDGKCVREICFGSGCERCNR